MTVLSTGLIGSDTIACSTWLEIGSWNPAMAHRTLEWPATAMATFFAPMAPRVVSTPVTRPFSTLRPVTSQFWMMSTPRASAARAKPQATASCRATPPRRCRLAPRMG